MKPGHLCRALLHLHGLSAHTSRAVLLLLLLLLLAVDLQLQCLLKLPVHSC